MREFNFRQPLKTSRVRQYYNSPDSPSRSQGDPNPGSECTIILPTARAESRETNFSLAVAESEFLEFYLSLNVQREPPRSAKRTSPPEGGV